MIKLYCPRYNECAGHGSGEFPDDQAERVKTEHGIGCGFEGCGSFVADWVARPVLRVRTPADRAAELVTVESVGKNHVVRIDGIWIDSFVRLDGGGSANEWATRIRVVFEREIQDARLDTADVVAAEADTVRKRPSVTQTLGATAAYDMAMERRRVERATPDEQADRDALDASGFHDGTEACCNEAEARAALVRVTTRVTAAESLLREFVAMRLYHADTAMVATVGDLYARARALLGLPVPPS